MTIIASLSPELPVNYKKTIHSPWKPRLYYVLLYTQKINVSFELGNNYKHVFLVRKGAWEEDHK